MEEGSRFIYSPSTSRNEPPNHSSGLKRTVYLLAEMYPQIPVESILPIVISNKGNYEASLAGLRTTFNLQPVFNDLANSFIFIEPEKDFEFIDEYDQPAPKKKDLLEDDFVDIQDDSPPKTTPIRRTTPFKVNLLSSYLSKTPKSLIVVPTIQFNAFLLFASKTLQFQEQFKLKVYDKDTKKEITSMDQLIENKTYVVFPHLLDSDFDVLNTSTTQSTTEMTPTKSSENNVPKEPNNVPKNLPSVPVTEIGSIATETKQKVAESITETKIQVTESNVTSTEINSSIIETNISVTETKASVAKVPTTVAEAQTLVTEALARLSSISNTNETYSSVPIETSQNKVPAFVSEKPTGPFQIEIVKGLNSSVSKQMTIVPSIKFPAFLMFASKLLQIKEEPSSLHVWCVQEKFQVENIEQLRPGHIVYIMSHNEFKKFNEIKIEDENPKEIEVSTKPIEKPQTEILVDLKLFKRISEIFPKIDKEIIKKILIESKNDSDVATIELLEINERIPDPKSEVSDDEVSDLDEEVNEDSDSCPSDEDSDSDNDNEDNVNCNGSLPPINEDFVLMHGTQLNSLSWYQDAVNQHKLVQKITVEDFYDLDSDEDLARALQLSEDEAFAHQLSKETNSTNNNNSNYSQKNNNNNNNNKNNVTESYSYTRLPGDSLWHQSSANRVVVRTTVTNNTNNSYTNYSQRSVTSGANNSIRRNEIAAMKATVANRSFNPDAYDIFAKIKRDFPRNYEIIKIETIIRHELLQRFENAYQTLSHSNNQVVPIFAYHGTHASNIPSIQKLGLLVPGEGNNLPVVHGSAFGKGIYLAIHPTTSFSYATGKNQLLVCAALVGNRFVVADTGNILVISNPAQVLPCYLVTYRPPVPVANPRPLSTAVPVSAPKAVAKPDSLKAKRKEKKAQRKLEQAKKQAQLFKQ